MVVRYKDADTGEYLVACGSNLPTASDIIYTLHGKWGMSKNGKYGRQFEVSYFDMEQPKGKAAIVSYFCSLKCGIGKVVSGRIYAKWGAMASGMYWSLTRLNSRLSMALLIK